MGVASWRWVRPILTVRSQALAFSSRSWAMAATAGRSSSWIMVAAATWMAVGKVSLEDWPRLTWSVGWAPPCLMYCGSLEWPMGLWALTAVRFAITSLTFMLVEVPLPVWKVSMGKWV